MTTFTYVTDVGPQSVHFEMIFGICFPQTNDKFSKLIFSDESKQMCFISCVLKKR